VAQSGKAAFLVDFFSADQGMLFFGLFLFFFLFFLFFFCLRHYFILTQEGRTVLLELSFSLDGQFCACMSFSGFYALDAHLQSSRFGPDPSFLLAIICGLFFLRTVSPGDTSCTLACQRSHEVLF